MRLRGCIAAAVAMLLNGAAVGQQSLAAERVIELVEARECYEAREAINQYLRAATPDVALLTLTGAMFEEGVCLKSSWSRAERLYLRAAETGYKPAMLRLAAGYARPIGGPDVAASLWWAHRARALSENNCAVEAPNDDADAFVAALKGWPAGRVERCAYAAAVLGALMADASFPRAAARREESGRLKVVLWPATGQFELTVLEGTTIRAADPRRWKLSEPHVGKVAGLMDYVQQLSTKAAIGVPVPADAPADWKIGVDLVFVLRQMTPDLENLKRFFASAPFMADLGIEPLEAGEGRVVTGLALAPRHLQHTGAVHAGVIGAMADHTMGAAAQTMAADGYWVLTAEFKVSLLRAGRGERLECAGFVVKPGRQVSFTEAEVFALDGGSRILVAKASATMAVTRAA